MANEHRTSHIADRRASRPKTLDPDQAYDLCEAAAALGQSRAAVYKQIARGELSTFTVGRSRRVLGAEIIRVNRERAGAATESSSKSDAAE